MNKPIVSLETGMIRGYAVGNSQQFLQESTGYEKIFYTPELDELDERLKEGDAFDHERMVIVLRVSDVSKRQKSLEMLADKIKKKGFLFALRISSAKLPGVQALRHWGPSYILLEKNIVSRLDEEPDLAGQVKTLVLLGHELHYTVIAEGIHTEKILENVLALNIPFGRGKLLQSSLGDASKITADAMRILNKAVQSKKRDSQDLSVLRTVGIISRKGFLMRPDEKAMAAYDLFEKNKDCLVICIVDEQGGFRGILTRTNLMRAFGGRYGYNLHMRSTVMELSSDTLIVYQDFSIETVARLAMERDSSTLYDPVVVLSHDKFYGIVTVKDLLTATVSIEVEKANEANPLTGLPGNRVIDQKIQQLPGEQNFFAILYLDLDNFKAFNDAYGFPKGDRMIQILAKAMKKAFGEQAFLGHVGGDDFVIITRQMDVRERARQVIDEFQEKIRELYNETDWTQGYIVAKSRKGVIEQFPIASVSIAIVTNQAHRYLQMKDLTEQIVLAKKRAKQIEGNSIVVL